MKKTIILFLSIALSLYAKAHNTFAKETQDIMQKVYEEVKTPYKYGMVVAPTDNYHKIDCPTVFCENGRWYMTYVVYNGKDGLYGRGYETWLASSDNLLDWKTEGRLLSYRSDSTLWDCNQRGGFPALIDWTWGGNYQMQKYKGRHWMTYIGGKGTGYEAVRAPLNIGLAWTKDRITQAHEWESKAEYPLLSIEDQDVQWWEKLVQYKSTVYSDPTKKLFGRRFIMFYNAGGVNPANNLKAERIGIALSDDMKKWKRYDGNPVYAHESPGIITGDAQIVKMPLSSVSSEERPESPLYVMFYFSAYNPSRKYNAYNTFAVSRDLVHWTDWDGADLIYPSKDYDDMFAHKSYVVKHDGVVYHFYCAVNKAGQRGIAVATSVPMGRSSVSFPAPEKTGRRTITTLNAGWQTELLSSNDSVLTPRNAPKPYQNTQQTVDIPHNWDDYYGYRQLKHGNLHGSAVYTRPLNVRPQPGRRYFLQFEGIGTYATVTINNHAFLRTPVGRTTYTLDVTDYLSDSQNTLSVRVDHPEMITDMPWVCGGCSSEWGFSEGSQPFGIFRPVTMIETAEVRVEPFGVHIWNNEACDSVFMETEIKNYGASIRDIEFVNKLAKADGKTAFRLSEKITLQPGETKIVRQSSPISSPHLWSLEDAYLYSLASMIKDEDNKTIDETTTEFGIRNISWPVKRNQATLSSENRFLLNGKPVFINGTCEYEHLFGASHAFSNEQIKSRVKQIRQAGFNAFREAHQPHHLLYQRLFDEQGMLFWSQFSAHIWYDTPEFRDNFKRLLRQWIKERRNSPSIVLWGLQNESVLPKDFSEECTAIIREMDPTVRTMRAVTTCNGGEGTDWNVVQNWSGTYGGSVENYDKELKQPNQLLNGEYGGWRTLGLHGEARYSEESFSELLGLKARLAQSAADSVCGHFQWLFVSHENPGRVQPDEALRRIDKVGPFNYKGLLTPWEQPTEGFYTYRNMYVGSHSDLETPTAADRNRDILKPTEGYTYLYRLNCGGDEYVDKYGNKWLQDDETFSESWSARFGLNPFTASQGHIGVPIHGADGADELFQYFRWGRHRLKFRFNVPDGRYRVELYFVEPWLGARYGTAIDCEGERIFDVAINDSIVVNDLDPWAEAGYAGALKRAVWAEVKGGTLVVSFPEVKAGQAVIAAIAVAKEGELRMPAPQLSSLPADYWHSLDADTVAKYPKELLPKDSEAFPATKYEPVRPGEWTITPGVAREYALRFRFRNTTGNAVKGRLRIIDSKGTTLQDREITFPVTPKKFKTLSSTTGTQINAGRYRVIVSEAKGVEFETLEVQ
ncbi:MAG: beta-galactosidase [Prevotella sp.]|nr:beta-galactosidase [Prevotella sp.]